MSDTPETPRDKLAKLIEMFWDPSVASHDKLKALQVAVNDPDVPIESFEITYDGRGEPRCSFTWRFPDPDRFPPSPLLS
ncbi:MAG: hypothetical protein LC772_00425 [Chloroflexi bacterium]|nr:hypothetical protein [Chloroflexota bacterium]